MVDQLIPQREYEAQERALRYSSHMTSARDHGDLAQAARWCTRYMEALEEWQAMVKEREAK